MFLCFCQDDQPDVHGPTACLSEDKSSFKSLAGYADVATCRLDLEEDIEGINQMEDLLVEGREMLSVLYAYRSCVKALPQLEKPQKEILGELYRETYHVLDTEIGRLRDLQRFQKDVAERVCTDMERFLCPEKKINGPTVAHTWGWLKILDLLLVLDHLKNSKASIPNDFTWYKRTFSRVCMDREDGDSIKEENDNLQAFLTMRWSITANFRAVASHLTNQEEMLLFLINFSFEMLESERVLLYTERHTLLRVVPLLLVMATPSEKDGEALVKSKKIKLERFIRLLKEDPIVPAFADVHMFPVTIVNELSPYFQKLASEGKLDVLFPRDMETRRANDYQSSYELVRHMHEYRRVHDEFTFRFAGMVNELQLLRKRNHDINDCVGFSRVVYDSVLEGLQLLSSYTGRVMEQCVWKYSRPARDAAPLDPERNPEVSAYERVVRCNYSNAEKKALVEMICYIKGMAGVLDRAESIVMDVVWEAVYKMVQVFAQGMLTPMLRTASKRKKKDVAGLLWNLRSIVADWKEGVEPDIFARRARRGNESLDLLPRSVAPSRAQLYAMQYLVGELLAMANANRGGFFGSDRDLSSSAARELENFGQELLFVPYVLDFRHTLKEASDLGFLWFRELYLEISHCVQKSDKTD
ncbi:hypothetical protein CBR_g23328 [Chara braunii]|uniref:CYRIA/CYRIB Rac1 binding domain-containing protein n=1 Tax=Chara braunii TaxID=69332 RepID=A0A388L3X4_CHABU|nr:hypothetical protein CBR_g23328 [Chara braunii]|eukprot:GBG76997.1 hypothetical protein CBR_g23328 [Chara braunii]